MFTDNKERNLIIKKNLKEIVRTIDPSIPVDEKDAVNDTIEVIFRKVLKRIIDNDPRVLLDKNAEYNYTLKSLIFKIVRRIYIDSLGVFFIFIYFVMIYFIARIDTEPEFNVLLCTSFYLSIYTVIIIDYLLRYRGYRIKQETLDFKSIKYAYLNRQAFVKIEKKEKKEREKREQEEREERERKKQEDFLIQQKIKKELEEYTQNLYFLWLNEILKKEEENIFLKLLKYLKSLFFCF